MTEELYGNKVQLFWQKWWSHPVTDASITAIISAAENWVWWQKCWNITRQNAANKRTDWSTLKTDTGRFAVQEEFQTWQKNCRLNIEILVTMIIIIELGWNFKQKDKIKQPRSDLTNRLPQCNTFRNRSFCHDKLLLEWKKERKKELNQLSSKFLKTEKKKQKKTKTLSPLVQMESWCSVSGSHHGHVTKRCGPCWMV